LRVQEHHDFLCMIEEECGGPGMGFEIEMHGEQTPLHSRQRMPPTTARIRTQQAGGGFGNLVDHRIFRYTAQEPEPLQHLKTGSGLAVADDQLLGLLRRAIPTQVDQGRQEILGNVIDTNRPFAKGHHEEASIEIGMQGVDGPELCGACVRSGRPNSSGPGRLNRLDPAVREKLRAARQSFRRRRPAGSSENRVIIAESGAVRLEGKNGNPTCPFCHFDLHQRKIVLCASHDAHKPSTCTKWAALRGNSPVQPEKVPAITPWAL